MSEPIQLEWEPAEWPEKQTGVLMGGVATRGAADMLAQMAIGDVIRVAVPAGMHPSILQTRLTASSKGKRVNAIIQTRQQGDYVYVRRVE